MSKFICLWAFMLFGQVAGNYDLIRIYNPSGVLIGVVSISKKLILVPSSTIAAQNADEIANFVFPFAGYTTTVQGS